MRPDRFMETVAVSPSKSPTHPERGVKGRAIKVPRPPRSREGRAASPVGLTGSQWRDAVLAITSPAAEGDDDPGEWDPHSIALATAIDEWLADELENRAWDPVKHPRGPDGKFLKLGDRIKAALDDHIKKGHKGDPFKEFNREQLRRVAKARGISLVRNEGRDSIAKKLIDDLKKSASAKPARAATKTAATKPTMGSAITQRPSLNHKAIAAATAVANGTDPNAHKVSRQLAIYRTLTKADFDSLDASTQTFIMSDLATANLVGTSSQSAMASSLVSRFSAPGTPAGVVPTPPIIPPGSARVTKTAASATSGTPGLLKKAKDQGLSGDGWFYPPGGGKAVWGKYGAAGLLLRHRGDDGVDRYLMVQRGPGISDPGKWQFPGGAIDSKETPFEGATREVLEELGFKDSDLSPGVVHGTHEASVAGGWKYTSIAADVPTQIKPNLTTHHARMETSDARWMTIEEIRKLDKDGKLLGPLAGGKLESNVVSLFPTAGGKKPSKPKTPPLPTHKPSKGRDLVGDKAAIDKLRQDVKQARKAYAGKTADDRLAAIGAMQGYDDVPTVATKAQIDKLLATGDYLEVWRGVHGQGYSGKTAAQIHEEMRSGPAWYGRGVFGNGYYLATDRKVAEGYSDRTPGSVARILIPKAAIVADHGDMVKQARANARPRSAAKGKSGEDGTLWDEGRWAAAKGVDGIRIGHTAGRAQGLSAGHVARPGAPAYNWLNRSVLIIQEG